MRQGCDLSPRSFSAVLDLAMRKWRHAVGQAGIDLMDEGPNLLDVRASKKQWPNWKRIWNRMSRHTMEADNGHVQQCVGH